jgi:hydroxymethylbilane synthase
MRVRIATRGSELALAQARYVEGRVREELGLDVELVIVKTSGDRLQDVSLSKLGGKGLFVKEIEEALLEGRADAAVHSAKDLPAELADGLALVAFPQREDPRDALVARAHGACIAELRKGARVGTGSARRSAQLLAARPDLAIVPLRGNVPTRIGKLESEALDAVVLACAGLDRLHRGAVISERISTDVLLPAVCQGTLAIETRSDDEYATALAALDDPNVAVPAAAERAFLSRLGGDCTTPMAVFAEWRAGALRVRGLLASARGDELLRAEEVGPGERAESLGREVAESVLAQGGDALLQASAAGGS